MEAREQLPEDYQVIRSLEVNNFRCFKSLKLEKLPRFVVVTGINGSGKTALLEALFVAGGNSAEIYLRTRAWRGQDQLAVSASTPIISYFEDFFHQYDTSRDILIRFTDSERGEREMRATAAHSEVVSLPFAEGKVDNTIVSQTLRFFWKTPSGETESTVEITADGINISRPKDVFPMVFLNPHTLALGRDIATRYSKLSETNLEAPVLEAVRRLFPEVLSLQVLTSSGGGVLWASVRGVDHKMPIGLLSAGINKFVAIISSILFAKDGTVLVDEVENGMYHKLLPEMWRVIAAQAKKSNVQLFLTTHSEEFLKAITTSVAEGESDYSLLHARRMNGHAELSPFSGKQFASALESGFEVR